MLHLATVEPSTLALLKALLALDALKHVRLVGGTALALQLGHRKSIDLDLFGELNMNEFETNNPFGKNFKLERIRNTPNIKIYLINNVKVDVVNYSYHWLESPVIENEIRLASLMDISAMKLSAITGRGTKKDFIDLSVLLEKFSLKQIMQFYLEKYFDGSEFMVLKSLGYFKDAEEDEMPEMLINKSWSQVKKEITSAIQKYLIT